jgi:hypothetical protein
LLSGAPWDMTITACLFINHRVRRSPADMGVEGAVPAVRIAATTAARLRPDGGAPPGLNGPAGLAVPPAMGLPTRGTP